MSLLKCREELVRCLEGHQRNLGEILKIISSPEQPVTANSYRIHYQDKLGNRFSVRLDLEEDFSCEDVVGRLNDHFSSESSR